MTLATANGAVRLTSLDVLNEAALTGEVYTPEFETAVDEVLRQEVQDMIVAALTGSPAVYEAARLSPVYVADDNAAEGEFYKRSTELDRYGGLGEESWTEDGVATFSCGTGPSPVRITPPTPRIRLESAGARSALERRAQALREEKARILLVMATLNAIQQDMEISWIVNNRRPLVRGLHDLSDGALASIFLHRMDIALEDRRGFLFGTFFDLHEDPLMHDIDRERAYGELTDRFKSELSVIEAQQRTLGLQV